jgi:hypothetical protein
MFAITLMFLFPPLALAPSSDTILNNSGPPAATPVPVFSRSRTNLAPRQVKHIKRHNGRVPRAIPIGGSTMAKGSTLASGWVIGASEPSKGERHRASHGEAAEEVVKKLAQGYTVNLKGQAQRLSARLS